MLQHWYELRLPKDKMGPANTTRFNDLASLRRLAQRHGMDALRGSVMAALRGERAMEPVFLAIGSGLFTEAELPGIQRRIVAELANQKLEYRIAATFGCVFYLNLQHVAATLTERLVLEDDTPLVVEAARDVVSIGSGYIAGGRCGKCGATVGSPGTPRLQALVLTRAS